MQATIDYTNKHFLAYVDRNFPFSVAQSRGVWEVDGELLSLLSLHQGVLPQGRAKLCQQLKMFPYPVLREALAMVGNPRFDVGKEIAESGALIGMRHPPIALWLGWMDYTLANLQLIRPPQQLWNSFDFQCHFYVPITPGCQPSTH